MTVMAKPPIRIDHAPARGFINTVASARCKKAPGTLQPFQRFGRERGKPLSLQISLKVITVQSPRAKVSQQKKRTASSRGKWTAGRSVIHTRKHLC